MSTLLLLYRINYFVVEFGCVSCLLGKLSALGNFITQVKISFRVEERQIRYVGIPVATFLFQAFGIFIGGAETELGGREEVVEKKVAHYQICGGFKWEEVIGTEV